MPHTGCESGWARFQGDAPLLLALGAVLALLAGGCCCRTTTGRCASVSPERETARLYPINPDGKYGYIDASGRVVIEPQFDMASFFNGQHAVVGWGGTLLLEGTWAFMGAQGARTRATRKEVEAFFEASEDRWWLRYGTAPDDPTPFEDGRGLWGLRRGSTVVLAPTYSSISLFGGGLALAQRDEEYVYLDRRGQVVWEPEYKVHLTNAHWQFDQDQARRASGNETASGPYTFRLAAPKTWLETSAALEVWKAEQLIATIPCQNRSLPVLLIREGTLYYADPARSTTGCVAGAVRLEDGKHLWRTNLKALWPYGLNHSLYLNEVSLRVQEGLMIVSANETHGRYVEALDLATGRIVGRHLVRDRTGP